MLELKRKGIVLNKAPKMYQDADLSQPFEALLSKDSEFELGDLEGDKAVKVTLPDGKTAYIDGDEEINIIQPAWTIKDTLIYNRPDKTAQSREVGKGQEIELLNAVEGSNNNWLRVRKSDGQIYFMRGNVRIITEDSLMESIGEMIGDGSSEDKIVRSFTKQGVPEAKVRAFYAEITRLATEYEQSPEGRKELSKKASNRILYGFLWVVGGIVATSVSYGSASGGGTYSVFYGAIIWGVIDIIRGVIGVSQYSSKSAE